MPTEEINDGMNRAARHSELVIQLLDTPEAQRTENIINNGLCHKAFPGIKYDRKLHLIDVAKRAKQTYAALTENHSNLPTNFLAILEAIAVTHDLGHPPFAHALRHVMDTSLAGLSHEEISARIIRGDMSFVEYFERKPHLLGEDSRIRAWLEKYRKRPSIPEILERFGVDKDLVARVLLHSKGNPMLTAANLFLNDLIDNPLIDIDKMAYLPRDSKEANIAEARCDPSRLLNGLRVVEVDGQRRIAVVDTSLDDLRHWVAARKYMYQHVYTHKTVLVYEAMLIEAVKRSLPHFKKHGLEIHLLTDNRLLELLRTYDEVSAELAADVEFGRDFKYAEAYSIRSRKVDPEHDHGEYRILSALQEFLSAQEGDFPEDTIRNKIVRLANIMDGPEIAQHEILVYMPYKQRTPQQWKERLGLFVYSHKKPSIVCSLKDMAEGNAPLVDIKAQDVFYELCKPETSSYFAVYCRAGHQDRVRKATKQFLDGELNKKDLLIHAYDSP